jgi:hypothetical protein
VSGPVQNPANQKIWGADINVPARPVAPATKGYDALIANRNGRSYDRANGQISNATFKWPLFITDISIDFSVQGSTAQSQLTRDFYPHNFVQPGFTVTGISLDNVDYGQMCDFIHMCQIGMIQQFSESNLIQLQVAHRGIPALDTTIINGVKVVENQGTYTATGASNAVTRTVNGVEQITGQSWEPTSGRMVQSISANGKTVKTGYNQSIRGPHKEIIAMGVIGSIQRIHQTAVPNPTWTFQFQVFRMIKGPYREGPTKSGSGNFKTWVDLLDSGLAEPGSISSTDAMKNENTAVLAKTLKDSANIFNTTSGHGSYTPGGQSSGGGSSGGSSGGGSAGPAGSVGTVIQMAKFLSSKQLSYNQANSVQKYPSYMTSGYDCAGGVAYILYNAGFTLPAGGGLGKYGPASSGWETWGAAGQGTQMTIWANSIHIFIEFHYNGGHQGWDSGHPWSSGAPWYSDTFYDTNYTTSGEDGITFTPRHWPGT